MAKPKGKARAQSPDADMTPLASLGPAHDPTHDENMPDAPDTEKTRKRGHTEDGALNDHHGETTPSSKRRRSSNWPLPAEPPIKALQPPSLLAQPPSRSPIPSKRQSSRQPSRNASSGSKFMEGSMNDKASQKPPSVFTRLFQGSTQDLSQDHLMADYEEDSKRPATSRNVNRISKTPVPINKTPTPVQNEAAAGTNTAEKRGSGIFRFGRSLLSSFNPAHIKRKFMESYDEAREELAREDAAKHEAERLAQEAATNPVDDRKARAEQQYAELKAAGGFRPTKVFVRGAVHPTNEQEVKQQRDSGVEMSSARSSYENGHAASIAQSATSGSTTAETRKSPFHFKTPSLSNLKKARSEAQLAHPRTPGYAESPAKQEFDQEHTLRKQQSKKNIQKEQKLSKRISDLESKLEKAKRELNEAQTVAAPPVPQMPAYLGETKTPRQRHHSNSPQKSFFTPGVMPSLPSERLLFPEQLHGDESSASNERVSPAPPQPTRQAPAIPESITKADIWTEDLETPHKPDEPTPKRKITKKRKSGDHEDLRYKPESSDDEEDYTESKTTPAKKRRSNKGNPISKKNGGTGRLSKKNTAFDEITSTVNGKAIPTNEDADGDSEYTTKVPLNGEPSHPTAAATPAAHPRARSTGKLRRRESLRSMSPAAKMSEDEVVSVVPDGDSVPPLPVIGGSKMGRRGVHGKGEGEDDGWGGCGEEIF